MIRFFGDVIMSIKPIDLQTLFMNLKQIGKEQAVEHGSIAVQHAALNAVEQEKVQESAKTIKKPTLPEEGVGIVHERKSSEERTFQKKFNEKKQEKKDIKNEEEKEIIRDPELGSNIDING